MRIVLGVAGGIAAYKAALLLRLFREAGHDVRVVPTVAALEFVGQATWEALSGQPATPRIFDDVPEVAHVRIGQTADLVVVAPATADLIARAAAGLCNDLLTATLLTARCPVLLAPAMHTEMWEHPATQANVATLRSRGVHILEPASGRLTGSDSGPGRLPEPAEIAEAALALVEEPVDGAGSESRDLTGRHVVISAGGTREPVDPVRFLGNRSTGRQGVALARTALARGARVTLVAAHVEVAIPAGITVVPVGTALELRAAVRRAAADADVVVMAAAVADYRPESPADHKLKKADDGAPRTVALVENPDILADASSARMRAGQVVVGFAAETGDPVASVLQHGRAKALRKGADLLVVNEVGGGRGFGSTENSVAILDAAGNVLREAAGTKDAVSELIWDLVAARLS